jgi:hypothetical protein
LLDTKLLLVGFIHVVFWAFRHTLRLPHPYPV